MRSTLIFAHRWVALVAGIVLFSTAASGLTLVFENAIDRALNPALWVAHGTGPTLPLDTLVARVERERHATVNSVNLSSVAGRAWTMSAGAGALFVNPYTGAINGTRTLQESQATLARRLHVLHVELFAGKVGRSIVGITSGVALFLVITGLCVWWRDRLFRVNTSASWKRVVFDLHHASGVLASLVLLVITGSGLVVHYDGLARAIRSLDHAPAPVPPTQPAAGTTTLGAPSFERIANAARVALPGAEIMFVSLGNAKSPATVAMRFPEDRTPAGRSRVFVDRNADIVLATVSTRSARLGTRLDNLKRSVHTGDVFGVASQLVWFIATSFLLVQIVSGALMWWNGRRARQAVSRGRVTAPRAV